VPREQLLDAVDGMCRDALQDFSEVPMRINAVESAGSDQTVETGCGLTASIGSGKQVIAPTENERADRALGRVVIDFYATILEVSG
jgi:hypothetical protein